MLATIPSATLLGVEGRRVDVEVHVSSGLPGFTLVGHPDPVCREARDRVRAALLSSGIAWPTKRVTVNLAPGVLRKAGPGLDLPISIGLLVATGELEAEAIAGCAFVGELGLDGSIRRVPGVVPMVAALDAGIAVVPRDCAPEATIVGRPKVRVARKLGELVECLKGETPWPEPPQHPGGASPQATPDLADVRGQPVARTALELSAAGGHHLLLSGPPGSGKTMLARRLPGLLPRLEGEEALSVTAIRSAAGAELPPGGLVSIPPFRAPHHGASSVALIGGGTAWMRPGEISLAHQGVLFLDEMAEFPRAVLDALRQPLEEGVVRVSRAKASVTFPASFLLVGATNPCPCGEAGPEGRCRCSDAARARYSRRLSGPLLDRFDLRVVVSRPEVSDLLHGKAGEGSEVVAARVAETRGRARQRGVVCNAALSARDLDEVAPLTDAASSLLEHHLRAGLLSGRGLHRVRRVARTVADLAGAGNLIDEDHVCVALGLRADLPVAVAA